MNANQIGWTDMLQMLLSFVFVVALLLILLHYLRKMQNGQAFGRVDRRMQVVETLGIGPRQKILIARVDGREFLLGVTASDIRVLGQWGVEDAPSEPVDPNHTTTQP